MASQAVLASGLAEKIGEVEGILHYEYNIGGECIKKTQNYRFEDHRDAFERIVELLLDRDNPVINDKSDIEVVGHRVVHGGEEFHGTSIIDDNVISAIKDNIIW